MHLTGRVELIHALSEGEEVSRQQVCEIYIESTTAQGWTKSI
jgi:hypothetical protein